MTPHSLLDLLHLTGLALAVGGATVKVALLLRCRAEPGLIPAFLAVSPSITRLIIGGLVLLTLSGIGFLLIGYPLRPVLVAKLVMVGILWAVGPVIDKVLEPRFRAAAPVTGGTPSAAFVQAERRYFGVELAATGLFWIIVALWVLG